MPLVCEGFDRQ